MSAALPASPGRGRFRVSGSAVPELLDIHAAVSATVAAAYAGVSVQAVTNWATRGYCLPGSRERVKLPVARDGRGNEIRDRNGRPKYRLIDVAKAESATRQRARRAA